MQQFDFLEIKVEEKCTKNRENVVGSFSFDSFYENGVLDKTRLV